MNITKKFRAFLIVCVVLMISTTAFAAKGSLTLHHGVRKHSLLGKISSTKAETSLGVILTIKYSNGTDGVVGGKKLSFNEKECEVTFYAKNRSGKFSCKYYCDGSYVDKSRKPWPFSF